jgi:hypothetical protein
MESGQIAGLIIGLVVGVILILIFGTYYFGNKSIKIHKQSYSESYSTPDFFSPYKRLN